MESACRDLADLGCDRVFLKGGALEGTSSVDLLYDRKIDEILKLESPRVDTRNSHGTGCTISAAITSCLAKGMELSTAVRDAKAYIDGALRGGAEMKIGAGHGRCTISITGGLFELVVRSK